MKKTIIAAFALGLFAAASANAVSWDCTNARSYSEKLICASPDLSKIDDLRKGEANDGKLRGL